MKKALSLVFILTLVITVFCAVDVFAEDATGKFGNNDALTWTWKESTTTLTISGNGNMPTYKAETLATRPYNAYATKATTLVIEQGITSIGDYAFDSFSALTSVSFPDGLTKFGGWSFQKCSKLTAVTIPASVKEVGFYAFSTSSKLSSVTLNEGLETLKQGCFLDCPIKSITLPQSLRTIGQQVFHGSAITTLTIPKNVTYIGKWLLQYANWSIGSNRKVIFEEGRTENLILPAEIFKNCKSTGNNYNLTEISMADKVYIADTITDVSQLFGGTTVPSNVTITTVDEKVAALTDTTGIGMPTVKLIPVGFESMNKYSNIYWTFADGQLDIYGTGVINNGGAFWHTGTKAPWHDNLANISKVVIHEGITGVNQYFLDSGATSTHNVSVKLPSTLTTIKQWAFGTNSGLSLDGGLPEGLTTIENSAFNGCKKITGTLVIPASVTSIGDSAFANTLCTKVVFVGNTTDKALTIGNTAFAWNWNLAEVIVPRNVTSMGTNVFTYAGDKALTVTFEGAAPATLNAETMFASRTGANKLNYYAGNSGWDSITSASFATGTGGSVTVNALPNKVNGTLTVTAMNNGVLTYRTNAALADQTYALIIAAYAADHTMVGVNFVEGTIKAGDNSQNKVIYVAPPAEEELTGTPEYYKVFLWDGFTNLEPVM